MLFYLRCASFCSLLVLVWPVLLAFFYTAANRETITSEEFRRTDPAFQILGVKVVQLPLVHPEAAPAGEVDASKSVLLNGLSHEYAATTKLATAYRDVMPEVASSTSTTLVILHGGTLGLVAYESIQDALVRKVPNSRVICYDQYGRGFSDRLSESVSNPNMEIEVLVHQLYGLLSGLRVINATSKDRHERVILLGVSLGAALAAAFAATFPDLISAVVFHAPVVKSISELTRYKKGVMLSGLVHGAANMPVVGEMLMRFFFASSAIKRGENEPALHSTAQTVRNHFSQQFSVKGTEKDFLSLLRSRTTHGDFVKEFHSRLASSRNQHRMSMLFQYATDDEEIDPSSVEQVVDLYRHSSPAFVAAETFTGGHFFASTKITAVVDSVAEFVKSI
eukprot:TRINITY_DN19839_c0_g1_i1.p1 TRINITY_DN19839_c0_g1~~TRINITY_DN19839_c0_g1_i1.p1  ORF type:complete len:393 (+),score=45.02 TRINITY_DN19839_c0_g1_i1:92-1270(+)